MPLEEVLARIEEELSSLEERRETLLKESRRVLQLTRRAVASVHGGRKEEASRELEEARSLLSGLKEKASGDLYRYLLPAESEYVEALMFYKLVFGEELPGYEDLGVDPRSYVLGLLDAIGECRRIIYDLVRKGSYEEAERIFSEADAIYSKALHLSVYDNVASGIRKKLDVAKIVLDDARRVLTELAIRKR